MKKVLKKSDVLREGYVKGLKYAQRIIKEALGEVEESNVGKILVSTWGYEQTNVDFFKVVRETPSSVWLQRIGSVPVESPAWGQDRVVPDEMSVVKMPPTRHKKNFWRGQLSVKLSSYSYAEEWDGKPVLKTSYA